jgi:hypothetical protein
MVISGWLRQAFDGKNGVVRRRKRDVHQYSSKAELLAMVKANDWHLIETDTQYVVIYDSGYMRIWR